MTSTQLKPLNNYLNKYFLPLLMDKKSIIMGFVLGLMFITACSQQLNPVAYEEVTFFDREDMFGCGRHMDSNVLNSGKAVVSSQEEYQAILDQYQALHECEWGKEPPVIDFSSKILLGQFAMGGGCSIEYVKRVNRFDEDKKLVYTVEVKEKGRCDKAGFSMNWITIPKSLVPSGYGVEFVVEK